MYALFLSTLKMKKREYVFKKTELKEALKSTGKRDSEGNILKNIYYLRCTKRFAQCAKKKNVGMTIGNVILV